MVLSSALTTRLYGQKDDSSVSASPIKYPSGNIEQANNDYWPVLMRAQSGSSYAYWACPQAGSTTRGCSDQTPDPGTVTVSYSAKTYSKVSVIGTLVVLDGGASLGAFEVVGKHGGQVQQHIEPGEVSFLTLLEHSAAELYAQTWGFRFLGWLIMWIGAMLVLMPAAVMADQFPIIGPCMGDLAECTICLVSFTSTVPMALTTIAICWMAYRPIIGGPILAAGLVCAVAGVVAVKRCRNGDGGPSYSSVQQSF
jgi:hypothetical protein